MAYSLAGLELVSRDELPPEISSLAELEYIVRDQRKAFLYVRFARLSNQSPRPMFIPPFS